MFKNKFIFAMLILLVSVFQGFATNGTSLNGFSPVSVGRGGLSYGFSDTPALMMNNPAGAAFLTSGTLEGSFGLLLPKLHFQNSLNDVDGESNQFPLVNLAYLHKNPDSKWIWGFCVFTQGGMGADFNLNHALFPNQLEYHSKFGNINIGPSLIYKADDISLGASAHLVYGLMDWWMPYSLSPSIMTGVAQPGVTFGQMFAAPPTQGGLGYEEVTAYAEMKELSGFGFSGTISAQYQVSDKLAVGAGFTSSTTIKLDGGTAAMDMTEQFNDAFQKMVYGALMQMGVDPATATAEQLQMAQGGVMQQLGQMGIDPTAGMISEFDVATDLTVPAKIGVGFSYRANDVFTFGADFEYLMWETAFDRMPLEFTGGSNANISKMLGGTDLNLDFPLEWENTYIIKLGSELNFTPGFTGRFGFIHGKNPVPDNTVFPVFPAIVENHITAGFSAKLSGAFAVHASYELALNKSQTSTTNILAREYNNSTSELMEHIVMLSFSLGL